MDPFYRWLALEALVPLFGAAVLFVIWGALRYVAMSSKDGYVYQWKQAFDPMGWLYGGAVLAFQAGTKGIGIANSGTLPYWCYGSAVICVLLLIAAMTERGHSTSWAPPKSLTLVSLVLVIFIVVASCSVQQLGVGVQP